ncbi:hypothetical protein HV819_02845 [Anaerococcus sp. AGMB00486]|uniref:Uncharacterized protein n=2 Tax=Anaerococcus TaxID=165779 RepID=A0ABX2N8A7_9FIRM|nr:MULTISPECIES: hypothetical protein [Anaerococcus]MSS77266.1 hypothetical protein [Anaerococcus porci]NVF10931.1 hypothetical protein [Anaerococcus faecalis]
MDYINRNNLTQNQIKLMDLKVRLVKAFFELNFSITGYNKLSQKSYDSKSSSDRIFMDSYIYLSKDRLFDFVYKFDKNKLDNFSYNPNDPSIASFLKEIEDIKKLDDDEIKILKTKIERRIKKIEGAANDIEYMLLGSLPKNYYKS